jgi:hypothetical protein
MHFTAIAELSRWHEDAIKVTTSVRIGVRVKVRVRGYSISLGGSCISMLDLIKQMVLGVRVRVKQMAPGRNKPYVDPNPNPNLYDNRYPNSYPNCYPYPHIILGFP